ncbi:MAG: hypothetical protein ABI647_22340 [Gemmatimonadota bacterium]
MTPRQLAAESAPAPTRSAGSPPTPNATTWARPTVTTPCAKPASAASPTVADRFTITSPRTSGKRSSAANATGSSATQPVNRISVPTTAPAASGPATALP